MNNMGWDWVSCRITNKIDLSVSLCLCVFLVPSTLKFEGKENKESIVLYRFYITFEKECCCRLLKSRLVFLSTTNFPIYI
jgi:hypothetical protein